MELQRILERVQLMTGDPRETLLMTLCADAKRELTARLTSDTNLQEQYADALCVAAAAWAVYKLMLLDAAQSPDSVTAGSVKAEFKTGCTQAKVYLDQCMRAVSPLLQDEAFYFGEVRT